MSDRPSQPPSIVQSSWATYRREVLADMEDAESLDAAFLIFLAGYRAALVTIRVLDKPDYETVRGFMLNQAANECDRHLRVSDADLS